MKKKTKTSKTSTNKKERTFVAFPLDRTGSMADVKQETIGGFNGYLDELLKKPESKDIVFHMTQFDSQSIDVLHDSVPLKDVDKLTDESYQPRAWTPLYDAVGKTIRAIEDKAKGFKVLFATLTDGLENRSQEWKLATVQALIKEKEDKDKWTFTWIGIGPEAWQGNAVLAAGTQSVSNILRATRKNTGKTFAYAAGATMLRASKAGGQSINRLYAGKKHLI